MIGRREAIAAVALMPLMHASAEACTLQLPLREQSFDKGIQAKRVATVRAFCRKAQNASADLDLDADQETAAFVKKGFTMPNPAPFQLESVVAFGDLVLLRARSFYFTGDDGCQPVVQVYGYYACHFDHRESDRIAMMDTITYG